MDVLGQWSLIIVDFRIHTRTTMLLSIMRLKRICWWLTLTLTSKHYTSSSGAQVELALITHYEIFFCKVYWTKYWHTEMGPLHFFLFYTHKFHAFFFFYHNSTFFWGNDKHNINKRLTSLPLQHLGPLGAHPRFWFTITINRRK
jgi:hypothetical protein